MTATQDLKPRPVEREKWSMRKLTGALLPFVRAAQVFSVVDTIGALCLLLLTIFIGVSAVIGREVTLPTYFLAPLFSIIHVFEKEAILRVRSLSPKPKEDVGSKQ